MTPHSRLLLSTLGLLACLLRPDPMTYADAPPPRTGPRPAHATANARKARAKARK